MIMLMITMLMIMIILLIMNIIMITLIILIMIMILIIITTTIIIIIIIVVVVVVIIIIIIIIIAQAIRTDCNDAVAAPSQELKDLRCGNALTSFTRTMSLASSFAVRAGGHCVGEDLMMIVSKSC